MLKIKSKMATHILAVIALSLGLVACEDDGGGSPGGLNYTGQTGPADLNAGNIAEVSAQICGQSTSNGTSIQTIIESLKDRIPLVEPATCAGNTGSVSTNNGIIFDNHCVVVEGHDVVIDGSIDGHSSISLNPLSVDVGGNIDHLTIRSGSFIDVLFDGELAFGANSAGGNIDINMLIKDNITGHVFKYTDFHVAYETQTQGLTMSGTISLPQFGEVTIHTTETLIIGQNGVESGQLELNRDGLGNPGAVINFSSGQATVEGSIDPVNFSCL